MKMKPRQNLLLLFGVISVADARTVPSSWTRMGGSFTRTRIRNSLNDQSTTTNINNGLHPIIYANNLDQSKTQWNDSNGNGNNEPPLLGWGVSSLAGGRRNNSFLSSIAILEKIRGGSTYDDDDDDDEYDDEANNNLVEDEQQEDGEPENDNNKELVGDNEREMMSDRDDDVTDVADSEEDGADDSLEDTAEEEEEDLSNKISKAGTDSNNNNDERNSNTSTNKSNTTKNKRDKENNDDERYSRQMYALGARAHGLVRSTTAILDGPLGAGISSSTKRGFTERRTLLEKDVRVEGADGFDGLNEKNKKDSSASKMIGGDKVVVNTDGEEIPSGLVYEIAKNLALSGVGRIIIVRDDDDGWDAGYFDGALDDLGAAYRRAALAEIMSSNKQQGRGSDDDDNDEKIVDEDGLEVEDEDYYDDYESLDGLNDGAELIVEYIQRLNPGVQVDIISRSKLFRLLHESGTVVQGKSSLDEENDNDEEIEEDKVSLGSNPVVLCVDRSMSAQLEMNDACRSTTGGSDCVPFVSVETAGVHARIFCDFGTKFVVVDEDGETPRSTLLDHIEIIISDDTNGGDEKEKEVLLTVHCLEGERHDVSRGDVIEYHGEHNDGMGGSASFPQCQVVTVKSPTCFTVREYRGDSSDKSNGDSSSLDILLQGGALSFSRVKLPKTLSFSSLREIVHPKSTEGGEDDTNEDKHNANSDCWDDDSLFAPSDLDKSFDPQRRRAVMSSMTALDMFVKKYGRLPLRASGLQQGDDEGESNQKRTDLERFQSLLRKVAKSKTNQKQWDRITSQFANTCRAKFTPVQAFSGALGAQEVLKAATGLYNPVHQFLLYDCDEVLQEADENMANKEDDDEKNEVGADMAPGQSYILGEKLSKKLASSRLFLVGAGAIGCELLKNLAAMGAGTGINKGCIVLTDMDTIERSNLSRQLLFRDHDVGEFKSAAARMSMLRFLPNCRVEAHTSRVGDEEDGPFDDDFWSSGCDVVLNALDNVEARLFVDRQCVTHGQGLIDAGTLGSKGNVQVVVPFASESYGSSADPPEPDIAVCTLKNFPYEISHTIQWARDLFDGYFHRRPRQANDHVEEMAHSDNLSNFAQLLIHKLGAEAAVDMAEELGEDLGVFPFIVGGVDRSDSEYVLAVQKVCLDWAIRQAHRLFFVSMKELLMKHPVDSVDDDGVPFWSGTRRVPKPLRFLPLDSDEDEVSAKQIIINERIAQFVHAAARLRMESFLPAAALSGDGAQSLVSMDDALNALEVQASSFYKKNSKGSSSNSSDESDDDNDVVSIILDKLNGAKTGASLLPQLNLADFEKDDEANGHVAFVTATSNLRAMAYGIAPADAMETRRVAGRIVPAMITTTGLVSALSCLELIKVLKGLPLNMHRNAFVNLALPFFAFTAPMPAEEILGVNGKTHTIWDRVVIKGSSKSPAETITLKKFLAKLKKKASCGDNLEIANVSFGPYMIYANFLHSDDDELLGTSLIDIVKDTITSGDDHGDDMLFDNETAEEEKKDAPANLTDEQKKLLSKLEQKRFIDFSVTVESLETGEEFELPPVRLAKGKRNDAETAISEQ